MSLTKELNKELKVSYGRLTPQAFRREGLIEDLAAPIPLLRAEGIYTLFSLPKPVILKNELIAGNNKFIHLDITDEEFEFFSSECDSLGERDFPQNKDHYAPNYWHILTIGIPGLKAEITASLENHKGCEEKELNLKAMYRALEGFEKMIENHALAAEELYGKDGYDTEKLKKIAANCHAVAKGVPETFEQALQLVWLCHLAFVMEDRFAMALGRLDQYLYPFYKKDIEAGTLTDEYAVTLLENVFIKLQDDVVNITIGGRSTDGSCDVNGLTYCVLKAVGNCNVPGPNLSFRVTDNTPDDIMHLALKIIGTGLGYPALMNNDVNTKSLLRLGYPEEDAYNYAMVGCIENFIAGKQPPWTDGRIDAPKYLDHVFHQGKNEKGVRIGARTAPISELTTMDKFMEAYEAQLQYAADQYYFTKRNVNDRFNQKHYPEPFLSLFCFDCIGRGLDINNGGAIYPSNHGAGVAGIATTADSLAAIEKAVFVDKKYTLAEISKAIDKNFEGYDEIREYLLSAPKYGNNDDFVDKYAIWLTKFMSKTFDKYRTRDGGRYIIGMASNISNVKAGRVMGATPDGRLAGEPISDAASPAYGRDCKGVTSALLSLAKPDYTHVSVGSVINQKYSPSMFTDDTKRAKLLALIRTYFKNGGQELQMNATSREVLIDAMNHPENYGDLVVRVSGFSAFYVTLDPGVQLDILNRTQQG